MKTWKPTTAGVLMIVAASLHIVTGIATIVVAGGIAGGLRLGNLPQCAPYISLPIITTIGIPLVLLGIVSLIGGISSLQRRRWGLALAGGICALMPLQTLLGILAIVFVALSRDEFRTLKN
jgi:hypothetical protein